MVSGNENLAQNTIDLNERVYNLEDSSRKVRLYFYPGELKTQSPPNPEAGKDH